MNPARLLAASSMLALIAGFAHAKDIEATTRIDAVTVFPGEAAITRIGKASIEPGEHTLIIKGLPAGLDPDSLRVRASAAFKLEIGSVETRLVTQPPVPLAEKSATERKIADLSAEQDALRDKVRSVEGQLRLIDQLAQTGRDTKADLQSLRSLLQFVGDSRDSAYTAIRNTNRTIKQLDDEIARLKATLAPNGSDQQVLHAAVTVSSAGRGDIEFSLDYRSSGARWEPIYEARLATTTDKPTLELTTRATLQQETGEDWKDVTLTLSTARPSSATAPVPLSPLVGQLWEPVALSRPRLTSGSSSAPAAAPMNADGRAQAMRLAEDESQQRKEVATERDATADAAGPVVSYRIPGRTSLAGNTSARTLRIGAETLAPRLTYQAIPKQATTAFLMASLDRIGDAPLLGGQVSLFRDGVFVGRSTLSHIPAGDALRLGFGEDERIRITYTPVHQTEGQTGTFTTSKMQRRDYRITVTNGSPAPAVLEIEDQLPVPENTDIRIDPLPSNTPATKSDPDGRRGIQLWTLDLKPKETRELRIGWTALWPTDKNIIWKSSEK